ncbi:MAG: hypothetical protein P4M08_09350 [Oligoflexia bacterium]|nr:hypothetical protein [Oligoflexia bacterium]
MTVLRLLPLFLLATYIPVATASSSRTTASPPAYPEIAGAPMTFTFRHLEPKHRYRISLAHAWFTDYVRTRPQVFQIEHGRQALVFEAPAADTGSADAHVSFTVGAIESLNGSDTTFSVSIEMPEPVVAQLVIQKLEINHFFIHDTASSKGGAVTANFNVSPDLYNGGVAGCISTAIATCDHARRCLDDTSEQRLSCYGPLQAKFHCCWVNPL